MHVLKFITFCLITFALNFGPNVGTYVLPATCFPAAIRSTFHGLSAASGKVDFRTFSVSRHVLRTLLAR